MCPSTSVVFSKLTSKHFLFGRSLYDTGQEFIATSLDLKLNPRLWLLFVGSRAQLLFWGKRLENSRTFFQIQRAVKTCAFCEPLWLHHQPRLQMSGNRRRKAAAVFAAAVGLCLAFLPPSLAFQFHALHGVRVNSVVSSSSSRSHSFRGRRSAATCRKLTINAGGQGHKGEEERRHAAGLPPSPAASRHSDCGTSEESSGRGGGGKDVAALVLSTLLLWHPRLAEAASPNTLASLALSTVTQESLLADLEKKLMKSPSGPEQGAKASSSAPEEKEADSGAKTGSPATRDAAIQPTAEEQPPSPPTASDIVPLSASQDVPTSAAPAAPAVTAKPSAAPKIEPSPGLEVNSLRTEEKGPLVKFQEYTFTVKLPELNLKNAPVAPITVPEDGSPFGSALSFERVRPLINLFAEPARETLTSAGKRGGFPELARSIGGVVPRQADYDR